MPDYVYVYPDYPTGMGGCSGCFSTVCDACVGTECGKIQDSSGNISQSIMI